jgi:hypothetical protein
MPSKLVPPAAAVLPRVRLDDSPQLTNAMEALPPLIVLFPKHRAGRDDDRDRHETGEPAANGAALRHHTGRKFGDGPTCDHRVVHRGRCHPRWHRQTVRGPHPIRPKLRRIPINIRPACEC